MLAVNLDWQRFLAKWFCFFFIQTWNGEPVADARSSLCSGWHAGAYPTLPLLALVEGWAHR